MPGDLNVDVKLDEFAKPADTFIKKISKGMGGMFAEGLAKREAKAEVEREVVPSSEPVPSGF
jgi:hypothetical protein